MLQMMHLRPYQRLIAWQEGYKLCLIIYEKSRNFPKEEQYGLTSQVRRAATSIPLNIAEGNRKISKRERAHFFERSAASLEEVHCCSLLAHDLKYFENDVFVQVDAQINRVSFLLTKLLNAIRTVANP